MLCQALGFARAGVRHLPHRTRVPRWPSFLLQEQSPGTPPCLGRPVLVPERRVRVACPRAHRRGGPTPVTEGHSAPAWPTPPPQHAPHHA